MKKIFLSATAGCILLAAGSPAYAADMEAPGADWTGIYGGATIGLEFIRSDVEQIGGFSSGLESQNEHGAALGVGAGFNYDLGEIVVGAEADFSLTDVNGDVEFSKNTVNMDYDWFSTARLRAGVDLDETLVYATGGAAFLNVSAEMEDETRHELVTGWTIGAGVEHRLSGAVTLKAEALYARFDRAEFGPFDSVAFSPSIESETEVYVGRVGLNYHFGY